MLGRSAAERGGPSQQQSACQLAFGAQTACRPLRAVLGAAAACGATWRHTVAPSGSVTLAPRPSRQAARSSGRRRRNAAGVSPRPARTRSVRERALESIDLLRVLPYDSDVKRGGALAILVMTVACSRTPIPDSSGGSPPPQGNEGTGAGGSTSTTGSTTSTTSTTGQCEVPACTSPWARGFASSEEYVGALTGIAGDACGNLLIAGEVGGPVDFGGTSIGGMNRGFLVALDPDGTYRWGEALGEDSFIQALSVDADRNVLVGGRFVGSLGLGGIEASAAQLEVFVAKLAPDGTAQWLHAYDGATDISALAVDAAGNVVFSGQTSGLAAPDFGGGPLAAGFRGFVASLDREGNHRHSQAFGDGNTYAYALAVDASGSVVVGGMFNKTLALASGPVLVASDSPSPLSYDAFLGKLSPTGDHLWSKRFGDDWSQVIGVVDIDSEGRIAVAGGFAASIDLGGGPLTNDGTIYGETFVGVLDAEGAHVASFGTGGGWSAGAIMFRDGLLLASADAASTASIARFDESGAVLEATSFENGFGIPVLGRIPGGIVFGGSSIDGVDFGTGPLPAPGFYIARACDPPP